MSERPPEGVTRQQLSLFAEAMGPIADNRNFREVTGTQRVGLRAFWGLLILVILLFGVLTYAGRSTYPDLKAVTGLVPKDGDEFRAWQDAQAGWLASVKDLGNTFIVTPILPLLGIILGYILGQRSQDSGS